MTLRAGYAAGKGDIMHYIRIEAVWKDRKNFESIMESETVDGVTVTTVYGQNRILRQESAEIVPEYEIIAPGWEFRTGASLDFLQEQSSQVYPYVFYRKTFAAEGFVSGMARVGKFDIRGRLSFRQGSFAESDDCADTEISLPEKPFRMKELNDMHMEYLTAPRMEAGLSLRFNFLNGLYAEIYGTYVRGFGIEFLPGTDRWGTGVILGYDF